MTTISLPKVTINIEPAQLPVSNKPQRLLYVGQMTSSGTATAGDLIPNIEDDNSWDTLFGKDSMLAGMIRRARAVNDVTRIDAIALDDGAGVNATGTITFTGTPTESGELTFYIGSKADYAFTISVATTDTPTTLGDALEAAITANTEVPFDAVNVAGVVTMTYVHAGTEGNFTTLGSSGTIAGVTIAIVGMSSGTVDPDTSTLFDVVGETRYQTIVAPGAWGTTYLTAFLDPRFNITNNVLDGVAMISTVDSVSNLETTGDALNSESLVIFGDKTVSTSTQKGASVLELSYIESAEIGAIRALRLTEDADISEFVISTSNARDTFGGPAISSLPYFNTPLRGIALSDINLGFTSTEINSLKSSGISVIGNNVADNGIIMGEVVTLYKTDSAGNPDLSFKFLNYVDTASAGREYMFNNAKADFAQSRLTDGDLLPGRAMNNVESITAQFVGYYSTLSNEDFVLTQAGEAALQFFKSKLTVDLDLVDGKAEIFMQVPIVTQLRDIIATFQLSFNI